MTSAPPRGREAHRAGHLLRVVDELAWTLRRDGFLLSVTQALDFARVVELVGFGDRGRLRDALSAVVVDRRSDLGRFRDSFDGFFASDRADAADLFTRLARRGFAVHELEALRELLEPVSRTSGTASEKALLAALCGSEGELDRLLVGSSTAGALAPMTSPLQRGFYGHALLEVLGVLRVASAIGRVRAALREALGEQRGGALGAALADELERFRARVQKHVDETLERRAARPSGGGALETDFASLDEAEREAVRRAVRRLAERLRGAERVRRRRSSRGRLDAHRTLRRSMATGGVPFSPAYKRRRRDRPNLVVLCDVSASVRPAARFMLELVHALGELFAGARSFVFVSDVEETTALFRDRPATVALAHVFAGGLVHEADDSNYGRALRTFEQTIERSVNRKTTIVILGDGRTNYHPDRAEIVRRLRDASRALLWICPEERAGWGSGDSAMPRYAAAASKVIVARCARDLELAAREIVSRR